MMTLMVSEEQLIGWSGFGYHRPTFKGTQAEWERFRLEGMKAGLFILGMVTPVIGGLYFTFVNHASLARYVKVVASAQCLVWTSNPAYQALHFFWSSHLY